MRSKSALWLAALLSAAVMLALLMGAERTAASREEQRVAEVLSAMAGAGRVEVALFYGEEKTLSQKPTGAVVVAEGADDVAVRLRLIRAVRTLLGLPETAVDVFEMEDGR